MNREELVEMVLDGKSIQDISTKYNKSKTSIRFWLSKYGLKTTGKAGARPVLISNDGTKHCGRCNKTKALAEFSVRTDRPGTPFTYCKSCISADATQRAYATKQFFVNALGGVCQRCDGKFSAEVYDFHHTEPEHKDFSIRDKKLSSDIGTILQELKKCILVCANCHQLIHHTMKQQQGYSNKIVGNTERWNVNKERKLNFLGKKSCDRCGYSEYSGALGIVFPEHLKQFRKYNKTNWTPDFEDALKDASVLCLNCVRNS